MAETLEFVTISLSRKQINMEPIHNAKNGKDYVRVIAPNGGTIFYPVSGIKIDPNDAKRVSFSRPRGTELTISYGVKNEKTGEWDNKNHVVTIEDLKEMYAEEIRSLIEQRKIEQENGTAAFVDFTVPTSWGREFKGKADGRKYVSISIPIKDTENNSHNYFSFVLPAERFKTSEKQPDTSYFGLPRMQKDHPDKDYLVVLKRNILEGDGKYSEEVMRISSTELKEHVDSAVQSARFIGIDISKKLVRPFEAHDQKLYSVAVPVISDDQKNTEYWHIVLPQDRIRESKIEGQVYMSLFRKNKDNADFVHKATHSIKNDTGSYDVEEKKFTSEEIIGYFKTSRQKYLEHQNGDRRSLQDELDSRLGQDSPEQSIQASKPPINRRQGRKV